MIEPFPAAAVFENLEMAGDIGVDAFEGVIEGMAHAGLRREMDHTPDVWTAERGLERAAFGEVDPVEGESGMAFEPAEPGLLQAGAVIVADIVDPDHPLAAPEKAKRRVAADEAGDAGDEDGHASAVRPAVADRRNMSRSAGLFGGCRLSLGESRNDLFAEKPDGAFGILESHVVEVHLQ